MGFIFAVTLPIREVTNIRKEFFSQEQKEVDPMVFRSLCNGDIGARIGMCTVTTMIYYKSFKLQTWVSMFDVIHRQLNIYCDANVRHDNSITDKVYFCCSWFIRCNQNYRGRCIRSVSAIFAKSSYSPDHNSTAVELFINPILLTERTGYDTSFCWSIWAANSPLPLPPP